MPISRVRLRFFLLILISLAAPRAMPAERPALKVGLALSGGGARGAAHIGALRVLEQEGIRIDCIAGTSFGALVGGLYALGYRAVEIEQIFARQDWSALFSNEPDLSLAPLLARAKSRYQGELNFHGFLPELPGGLIAGQKLTEVLDLLTTERILAAAFDFDRLPIPFRAVATDIVNGEKVVFQRGTMTEAIRASIAVPLVFTPVEKDGMLLVDGGLVDNLPTDVVRQMGADIVIAIDATSPLLEKDQIKTFVEVMDQSIGLLMRRGVEENIKLADLVLRPELKDFTVADYLRIPEIVQLGAQAAESRLGELKALLARVPARPMPPAPTFPLALEVASVSFEGLKRVPAGQLKNEIRTRPGQPVDVNLLEEDQRRLYATGLFEHVDYRLTPAGPGSYHLAYLVRELPAGILGASIRYDPDNHFVALAELRVRQLFHTPSVLIVSTQFGGIDNDSASLRYIPFNRMPFLFVTPEAHFRKREYRDFRSGELVDSFTDRRIGAQLMVGAALGRSEFEFGYRADRVTILGGTPPNRQDGALHLRGVSAQFSRNTLDAQRFPTSGTYVSARADAHLDAFGSDVHYSKWDLQVRRYFRLTPDSSIQVYGAAGYSRGSVPFYDRYFLGGFNYSEIGPQRLIGFQYDELSANQMGVLAAEFRYRWYYQPLGFAKSGFIAGYYNAAPLSLREEAPYDFRLYHGMGAEFSFDTMIGPVRLAAGWGQGGRFNLYLTFGPAF